MISWLWPNLPAPCPNATGVLSSFDWAQADPYAVQVPRPLFDFNSLEYGVHLFERLQAESLLLAA